MEEEIVLDGHRQRTGLCVQRPNSKKGCRIVIIKGDRVDIDRQVKGELRRDRGHGGQERAIDSKAMGMLRQGSGTD